MDQIGRSNCYVGKNPNWKVSLLITNNQWHLFLPMLSPLWDSIAGTDIHAQGIDTWSSTCTRDGSFSFKTAWQITRVTDQKYENFKLIWFPSHCPKMAICFLRALLAKLLKRDKLQQFGIIQTNT